MIKLIEKRVAKTTYIIELDHDEMKEIWSVVGTAKFSCEEALKTHYRDNPESMKKRIEFLRCIEKTFYDAMQYSPIFPE